jgi:enamine deaminase RidA (YjgF/YER057c/UK114 family)
MTRDFLQPDGWIDPRGYSNGVVAEGRVVFVAGQIGWDPASGRLAADFVSQTRRALQNIVAVLAEAGGGPSDVVRLTWYITDRAEYVERSKDVGVAYREVFGRHYPAMSVVIVAGLLEEGAKVEIEATAVIG